MKFTPLLICQTTAGPSVRPESVHQIGQVQPHHGRALQGQGLQDKYTALRPSGLNWKQALHHGGQHGPDPEEHSAPCGGWDICGQWAETWRQVFTPSPLPGGQQQLLQSPLEPKAPGLEGRACSGRRGAMPLGRGHSYGPATNSLPTSDSGPQSHSGPQFLCLHRHRMDTVSTCLKWYSHVENSRAGSQKVKQAVTQVYTTGAP